MNSRLPRWLPPVIGAAVFVAVLLGAGLLSADWAKRSTEMRSLVAQIEVSEQAMGDTQQAVQDAIAQVAPTGPPTAEDQAELDRLLMAAAANGLLEVTRGGDLVASVQTLPWHADVREAQEAYLAHNRAWQAYLAAAAEDPAQFAMTQDDVNSTFAAAEAPLRNAVPMPDAFGIVDRLDEIFAPPAETDSGPTESA